MGKIAWLALSWGDLLFYFLCHGSFLRMPVFPLRTRVPLIASSQSTTAIIRADFA